MKASPNPSRQPTRPPGPHPPALHSHPAQPTNEAHVRVGEAQHGRDGLLSMPHGRQLSAHNTRARRRPAATLFQPLVVRAAPVAHDAVLTACGQHLQGRQGGGGW